MSTVYESKRAGGPEGETAAPPATTTVLERRRRPRGDSAAQALHFAVPGLQLCLPLDCVARVLPIMALQEVPQAAPWLLGLMNLGGEIVPVLDLASWLQRPGFALTLDSPVLLVGDGRRRVGLLAERVDGVAVIDNAQRRAAPPPAPGRRSPFVAVFERGPGLSFMLDLAALLELAA